MKNCARGLENAALETVMTTLTVTTPTRNGKFIYTYSVFSYFRY